MTILRALRLASSEHVVYFLLTAYVETLHYFGETQAALPPHVTRLPLSGKADVAARLRTLSQIAREAERYSPTVQCVIEEATEIFAAASRRLSVVAAQPIIAVPASGAAGTRGAWTGHAPANRLPDRADTAMESGYGGESAWCDRRRDHGKRNCAGHGHRRIRSTAE